MKSSASSPPSWPGLTRPSTRFRQGLLGGCYARLYNVDGRVKPGHDEEGAQFP